MTKDSSEPSTPDTASVEASPDGSSSDGPQGAQPSLGAWGSETGDPTWTPAATPGESAALGADAAGPGRSKRPTAYGLPPVTQRSSDLRSTISDALTTKAPSPLSRLGAAAASAAAAVGSAASAAGSGAAARASGQAHGEHETTPASPDSNSATPRRARPSALGKLTTLGSKRPEVLIGAAFAGGLLMATILKRLAR